MREADLHYQLLVRRLPVWPEHGSTWTVRELVDLFHHGGIRDDGGLISVFDPEK